METLKYFFCLCLIIAPAIQANPASIPSIEVSTEQLKITAGDSDSVTCTPKGNPLPSVQWRKAEGEFGYGTVTNGNTLLIGDAEVSDAGYYACVGVLGDTEVAQKYVYVDIENSDRSAQGSPSVTVSEKIITIPKGGSGSVECTPEGNPRPRVQWIKSNGELRSGVRANENTLTISDAREEDEGHYVCQGIVDGTVMITDFAAVTIENLDRSAQGSPSVTVSEKIITIPKGGSGSVECTPAGNPRPRVQWIKSNGELRSGVRANENTLTISDAREEDEGHYVCQGIVDGTVMITDFAAVTIENVVVRSAQSNFKVLVSQRTLVIPLGGRGTIECTPEGTPLPRIEWKKSRGEFSEGISQSGNTLIISDAREEDRGNYVCHGIVDDIDGTVVLANYTAVEIDTNSASAAVEKSKVSVSVERLKIPEGGSGSVTCNPGGSPLPSIQWRKHDGELSAGTIVIGNTLTITNARESDRGYYLCSGVVSDTVVTQEYVNIDVERVSQTPSQRNLRLILSERQLGIPEGGSGTIECTPEGDPLPRVQWIKSNGGLRNGIIQRGNTLTISDAQIEDHGHYVCQGIVDGTVMLTNYSAVDIERRSPPPVTSQPPQSLQSTESPGNPKITVSERQPRIPLGGNASIECTPEGYPLPRVQWIKSNGEFRNGIGQSGNSLIISDARKEDGGHYVCQGIVDGTVLVTDFSTVDIESNEGTPDQFPKPLEVVILEGSDSIISCDFVTGDLEQEVTWTRTDRPLPQNAQVSGQQLIIQSAKKEDSGDYLCKVTVSRGGLLLRVAHARLVVLALPLVSVRPPAQTVTRGQAVTIECVIHGDVFNVTWDRLDGSLLSSRAENQGSILHFNGIEVEDAGYYRCSAKNRAGISSGLSQVIVNDVEPPAQLPGYLKLIVSQRQVIIPQGGSGSIECTPEGNPLPRVQWIKSNGEFRDGIRQSGNTLIISDARKEDRGHYACQGIVAGTVMLTNYTAVDIRDEPQQAPPANLRSPNVVVSQKQLSLSPGVSVSIECTPEGSPLPRIQWIKSNGEFSAGVTQNGNTLAISYAQKEDEGHYVCQGIVDGTVMVTDFSAIYVQNEEPPAQLPGYLKLIVSQRQVIIPQGGSGSIECTPEGNPLPRVQWIKANGEFRDGIRQSGNTLIISDAREEDRGHYACQGIVAGTVMLTNYTAVDVRDEPPQAPPANLRSPNVVVSQKQLIISPGESVSIECRPEGSPLPRVQWIKSNGEFSAGVTQNGNTLAISYAQKEDEGHYVCQGIVDGTVMVTDFSAIYVQNEEPPAQLPGYLKLIVSQRQVIIPQGGSGSIECTPEGNPLPRVQWIKANGEFRDGIRQSGNTLIISDAREEDRGHYACQGIVAGTVMLTNYTAVDVRDEPQQAPPANLRSPNVVVSQKQLIISPGESVSIECRPEGSPLPRVQWIKSNGEFSAGVTQNGNTLAISYAQKEDEAHYVCQGIVDGTVMMTDFSAIYVQNEEPPAQLPGYLKLIVSQRQVIIPQGGSGSIECTPEGNPLPRVQWIKANGEFRDGIRQSGNTLIISDARKEDRGHYACQGIVAGTVMLTNYTAVDVRDEPQQAPPANLRSPNVVVSQKQLIISPGESVSIECRPEGSPLPRVQWIKSNGEFSAGVTQNGNTLAISYAQKEDEAHYVCQGIVDGTVMVTDFSAIFVQNEEPPAQLPGYLKLIVSQRQVIIPQGGSGSIECTPEGNPLPRVQWIKANGEFRDGIRQSGNTLIISDAREEDRGHYACQGIVAGTVMLTNYTAVDVRDEPLQAPPANLRSPNVVVSQKQLNISPGESVSIECRPEGSPLPRVQWIKSNGEFSAGVTQNGNTLAISYAQKEDEAHYVCQGIVDGTVMVTDFSAIFVQNEEPPAQLPGYLKLIVSQRQVIIPQGGSGSIECTPEGNPLPRVQWIKANGEFRDGIRQSGNTLIISDAREEDRGHYACEGIVAGTVMLTNYTAVDVRDEPQQAPPANLRSPNVVVSQKQLIISPGESVSIECRPEGSPLPRVQWIKSNGEFSAGVTQNGNTLAISYAQKEDEAHYVCQGIVDGTVMVTDFSAIFVQNEEPPAQLPGYLKLIVSQRQVIIPQGGSGSIECTPEGNPLPRVQWIKANGEFRDGIRQSGNTLIISDAREEDRGHYACEGIVAGTVMLTNYTAVDVRDEPQQAPPANLRSPNVVVSQKQLIISPGESVSIECRPEGSPLPRVQWIKSNGEFSAGVTQNGNTLAISYAQKEDEAHYVCQGIVDGTVMVTDFSAIFVQNEEPPAQLPGYLKLIVSQRQVIIPQGGSGSIECTPEGNPLPRVQWIKANGEFRDGIRQSGNTLIISDREEDRGHYACQGIVAGTVMLTNYTAVDVRDEPQQAPPANLRSPNVVVSQKQLIISPGESVSIECRPEGSPLPRVQWIKSNGEFTAGVTQKGNTLAISYAQKEDEGHYVCQGIVDGTVMVTDFSAIYVQNEEPPAQLPGYLKLIVSQRQVIIPQGGSGSIECTPEGNPLPRVQWIKANGEFRDGIRQSGNTLIISDARKEDRGHYACQGIVAGTVMLTNYTAVDIRDEPQQAPPANLRSPNVVVSQKQLSLSPGVSVSIECTPEGSPLPRIQWIKSNGEFSAGVTQNGNTLTISYAQKEDEGHYVCQGIVDGTVMVTDYSTISVQKRPPVVAGDPRVQINVQQLKIPKGGSRTVECTPEGNPVPTIQWSKHDGEFGVGTRQSGNALIISDAQEQDGGYYVCDGMVGGTTAWMDYLVVEIESICELPQETGECRAAIEHWYYDTTQQRCQKFIWGGCGGNKNNFVTEEQCSLECERMRPNAA